MLWLVARATFVIISAVFYCLLALPAPLYRATARLIPQPAPITLPRADITQELDLLAYADPGGAAFERMTHAPIYEINSLQDHRFSFNQTGTTIVVINKARLPTVELRTLAISHELYHAAHRFALEDLVFPEESQAHLHTQRTAAALHVRPPTEEGDTLMIYAPTALLVLVFLSSAFLWFTRPTAAEMRRLIYK